MYAVVLAGGIPGPEDPLFEAAGGRPKSLIDIAGRPMAQWVVDALDGSASVDGLTVVGLGPQAGLRARKPVEYLEDHGGLMDNALAGIRRVAEIDPASPYALIASVDIPGITAEMVDWRVRVSQEAQADFDYIAVERSVMEKRYPGSNRSYIKIRGLELCGGDLNVARTSLADRRELWAKLVASRKSAFKQAALLGFDTLLLLLTRQLTIPVAERLTSRRLGLKTRVHLSPYAELAMDVDKPHQLAIVREDLGAPRGKSF
jgi:molybdopterin-guanine dinucleotide biosynthesis protein A